MRVRASIKGGALAAALCVTPAFADATSECSDWRNTPSDRLIIVCSEVIQSDPRAAWAYKNRGNGYRAKGEADRAMVDYNEAIKLDPKYDAAYNNRGLVYYRKGDYDRAIADYSEAIRLDPKLPEAYQGRGNAYANKGDYDRAIADYNEAIRGAKIARRSGRGNSYSV